jgi:hypothetical protein
VCRRADSTVRRSRPKTAVHGADEGDGDSGRQLPRDDVDDDEVRCTDPERGSTT